MENKQLNPSIPFKRRELAGRLREKAPEIEEAIFDRIRALGRGGRATIARAAASWCARSAPPELACEVHSSTDVVFERLIRAVGEEHERERQKRSRSREACRLERVEELLSGRIDDAPELGYALDGTRLG